MMQTQWPGLAAAYDFSSLETTLGADDGALRASAAFARPQPPDALVRPWWTCGTRAGNGGDPLGGFFSGSNGSNGSLGGVLTGLVGLLQQLVGALLNQPQNQTPSAQGPTAGGPQQQFKDVDVSSVGDPHLGVVGTREGRAGDQPVDAHWDSMTAHDDLVHSNAIEGGYRVSTAVTQPGANGVTVNQSATVHTNFDQDAVTLNRDGSFAIYDDGRQLQLGKGESATLSGDERVTVNQDGSLTVSASDGKRGTIATTLRANGQGVDVTTHAHEIALGGDAVTHDAHRGHGGHRHAHEHGHAAQPAAIIDKAAPIPPPAR